MLSCTRGSGRTSGAGRPRTLRGFAHFGLIAVWVVFWLNTALLPCCEVAAAVLGGHADNGSQSASAPLSLHHSDVADSESSGHGPDSPCGYTLNSDTRIVGENEVLKPDRSPSEWFALDAPVVTSFTAALRAADVTFARGSSPPSLRLYRRTQRLLI